MGIYFKMSLAYLKKKKLRTSLLVLGIVLGIVLIFGTSVLKESESKNIVNAVNKLYGGYHVEFRDLSTDKTDKLKNDKNTSRITTIQNLGNITDKKGNLFYLKSVNKEYMERMASKLIKGRLPKNNKEIVMDRKALESMNLKDDLGSTINLKIKKKYKDSKGNNEIYMADNKFKLVGVTEKPQGFYDVIYELESFTYGNYGNDNIIPRDSVTYNSLLSFKNGGVNVRGKSENLMMKYDLGKDSFLENGPLLVNLSEVEMNSETTYDYKIQSLIIITSAIFVFNIFNITINETIKEMGLLRLVGSSKKNVRSIIIYQALIIMIVGIVLGIIIGAIYSYIGINISDIPIYKEAAMKPKLFVSNKSIVKAIIPGVIAVFVSCIIPIVKISKISPVDAVKKVDKIKVSKRICKFDKILGNIFGFYGLMGLKNLGRNKVRAIISIISIALGGYVFVYTFSSMQGEVDDKINRMHNSYDIEMQFFGGISDLDNLEYTDSDLKKIREIKGVKSIDAINLVDGVFKFKKNDVNNEFIKYNGIKDKTEMEGSTTLTLVEDEYIENNIKDFEEKGNADEIGTLKGGYPNVAVYNYFYDFVKDSTIKKVFKDMKIGDIISLKTPIIENGKTVYKENKVRVCATLNPDWIAYGDGDFSPTFKIFGSNKDSELLINKKKYTKLGINLKNSYDKSVNKSIEKISSSISQSKFKSKLSFYEMRQDGIEKYQKTQLSITVLVLAIAGINIYCTIRTNLLTRKKELSTLRALGLSMKNMRKMVIFESLTYAILSFMISLIPTTVKLVEFVNWNNNAYKNWGVENFMSFTFPVKESIIFFLISTGICLLAVAVSTIEFNKMSITEGIKCND